MTAAAGDAEGGLAPSTTTGPAPGRSARRELVVATVLAVVGGALALYASSRTWVVTETPRPEPLAPLREVTSGRDTAPWVAATAVVALAGGVALLATRRAGRVLVGVVLAADGAGTVAAGLVGWTGGTGSVRSEVSLWWPATCLLGGVAVVLAGVLAAARGRRWTSMGTKYAAPGTRRSSGHDSTALWDSLDRGEDPTR